MKQGLSLGVSQHLALTPQLQQSIRLLQLSTLELSQEVDQMLDDNPFLEKIEEAAPREDFGVEQEDTPVTLSDRESELTSQISSSDFISEVRVSSETDTESIPLNEDDAQNWDGDGSSEITPDDSEWGGEAKPSTNNLTAEDNSDVGDMGRPQESLQSYLHRQALGLRLSPEDTAALRFLIESLNEEGYLEDDLISLAEGLGEQDSEQIEQLVHHFTVGLSLLQSLDPIGVGARNLSECLCLQIRYLQHEYANDDEIQTILKVALSICNAHVDLLARRDIKRLILACGATDREVREAIVLIGRLEPKPGRSFIEVERNIVVPDIVVKQVGVGAASKFVVRLNADVMPRLRVHDIYANALKNHKSGSNEAANSAALQQRLQEARWFIKNIQQRFETILRVSKAIVDRQKNFFVHGALAMRPLVLREIADELGLHESTISRVTTAKYISTPFGTFELKYFFGSGLVTDSGANASSTAVRALIKQFISAESQIKPLSDSQISEMLKEQGIDCARRTVAKYREGLRIATASLRKSL